MGKRGQKPERAKLHVLEKSAPRYPNPLPGMTAPARTVWKRIVKQFPERHFLPHHYDQLRAYCEACAMHKAMVSDVQKEGHVVTNALTGVVKENPKIGIMDKMAGRMQGMAVKLGITKNATINNDPKSQPLDKPKDIRKGLMFNG